MDLTFGNVIYVLAGFTLIAGLAAGVAQYFRVRKAQKRGDGFVRRSSEQE